MHCKFNYSSIWDSSYCMTPNCAVMKIKTAEMSLCAGSGKDVMSVAMRRTGYHWRIFIIMESSRYTALISHPVLHRIGDFFLLPSSLKSLVWLQFPSVCLCKRAYKRDGDTDGQRQGGGQIYVATNSLSSLSKELLRRRMGVMEEEDREGGRERMRDVPDPALADQNAKYGCR